MNLAELEGAPLTSLIADAAAGGSRDDLYRALQVEPVCVAALGPGAPSGPSLRLGPEQTVTRIVDCARLGAAVVSVFSSSAALAAHGDRLGLWADGKVRGALLEGGTIFPLLRGHPGMLLVANATTEIALDGGEVAALGDAMVPAEYEAALRALVVGGHGREVVRRLAARPLYTLGHAEGGLALIGGELPVFLHLEGAERLAAKVVAERGEHLSQGLVAGAELFKNATRAKLTVVIHPGPAAIRLRPEEMR